MALCLAYFVLSFLHYATLPKVDYLTDAVDEEINGAQLENRSAAMSLWSGGLSSLFSSGMSCIMLTFSIVICLLRFKVREQFQIPATCDPDGPWRPSLMGRAEDCASCYCCSCCTLAQMARHTHAVDEERCETCGDALDDPGPLVLPSAILVDDGAPAAPAVP